MWEEGRGSSTGVDPLNYYLECDAWDERRARNGNNEILSGDDNPVVTRTNTYKMDCNSLSSTGLKHYKKAEASSSQIMERIYFGKIGNLNYIEYIFDLLPRRYLV